MNFYFELNALVDAYNNLGPAGLVLIFFALYGVYLGIRNLIYIRIVKREFKIGFSNVLQSKGHAFEERYNGNNPLLAIIWDIVRAHGSHSSDMRSEIAYLFHRNFENINKSLYWIRLIAMIAPLLGLLGTVFGMVEVFQTIAATPNPDTTVLAGGIWEALVTTALGLSIAIPMLMMYYYLLLRFKAFHIEAVEYSYRALYLCEKNKITFKEYPLYDSL